MAPIVRWAGVMSPQLIGDTIDGFLTDLAAGCAAQSLLDGRRDDAAAAIKALVIYAAIPTTRTSVRATR